MGVESGSVQSFGETDLALDFNNYTLDRALQLAGETIDDADREIARTLSVLSLHRAVQLRRTLDSLESTKTA